MTKTGAEESGVDFGNDRWYFYMVLVGVSCPSYRATVSLFCQPVATF